MNAVLPCEVEMGAALQLDVAIATDHGADRVRTLVSTGSPGDGHLGTGQTDETSPLAQRSRPFAVRPVSLHGTRDQDANSVAFVFAVSE